MCQRVHSLRKIAVEMLVTFSSFLVAGTKTIFDYNFVDPLKKLKNRCRILEYSCTLYIDIFTVEMEVSLKKRIASRGWHVYCKTVWKDPRKGEPLFAEKETDQNALISDGFLVAS